MPKPRPMPDVSLDYYIDRFAKRVCVSDSGCWEWSGTRSKEGYGKLKIKFVSYRTHRLSYYLFKEDPGEDLVLHECDNKPCCNPEHLYLGGHSENAKDAYERGQRNRGDDHYNTELTESDVVEIRDRADRGESYPSIAEDYPITKSNVGKIVRRSTWAHV